MRRPGAVLIGRSVAAGAVALALVALAEAIAAGASVGEVALAGGLGLAGGALLGFGFGVVGSLLARLPRRFARAAWPLVGLFAGGWLAVRLGGLARLGGMYHAMAIGTLIAGPLLGGGAGAALALVQPDREGAPLDRLGRPVRIALAALGLAAAVGASLVAGALALEPYPLAQVALRAAAWIAAAVALAAAIGHLHWPRQTAIALSILFGAGALVATAVLARRDPAAIQPTAARGHAGLVLALLRRMSDVDGDGYSSRFGGGDCDAWDHAVSPGAAEIAGNGIDDNCQLGDAGEAGELELTLPPLPAAPSPCSVVLVTIDSVRVDHASAYGYARDTTPTLRALAARGTRFDRAFTTGSWTSIAISSLMRGRYPRNLSWSSVYETNEFRLLRRGVDVARPGELVHSMFVLPLDDRHPTLAELLARRGMTTFAAVNDGVSEFLSARMGTGRGFAELVTLDHLPVTERDDARVVDAALAFLERAPPSQPTFLWLHLYAPHFPSKARPTTPEWGEAVADAYDEEIWYADAELGRLVAALDRRGGLPVGVVVAADHGEVLGRAARAHGLDLHEASVHVPLVVAGCGFDAATIAAPVSLVDVVPTILAMTATPAPGWLDGVDLRAPPARRDLMLDLWRYGPTGAPVSEQVGATDGDVIVTIDLMTSAVAALPIGGREAIAPVARARLEAAARAYLEASGGRLRPGD